MKKKIIRIAMCVSIIVGTMAGCGNTEQASGNAEQKPKTSIAEAGISAVELPEEKQIVKIEEFSVPDEYKSKHIYKKDTDYNSAVLNMNGVTYNEDTVYFINNGYIFFYSKDSRKGDILCSKPDCTHLTDECNALLNCTGLQYYNDSIYTVAANMNLIKISNDGTTKDNLGQLLTVGDDEKKQSTEFGMAISWIIHRGYIYYVYQYNNGMDEDGYYLNNSNCIYRKPIDSDGEAECILVTPYAENNLLKDFNAYGIYVYFSTVDNKGNYQIYRYNTENDTVENLENLDIGLTACAETDKGIYYIKEENAEKSIWFYDYSGRAKKKCFDVTNETQWLMVDDNKIYYPVDFDKDMINGYIGVADADEGQIAKIQVGSRPETDKINEYILFVGGDEKNIYLLDNILQENEENIWKISGNSYSIIMSINKNDLESGELKVVEWGEN